MTRAIRSDAARNRAAVLAAADQLFAEAAVPARVSMGDVATAAGVGKATVFRAFGNRDGLIQALWSARFGPLRAAVEDGPPPLGPATDPRERIAAVLDATLSIKLENRHLTLAVEDPAGSVSLYEQPQYLWLHRLLRALLDDAGHSGDSELLAHVLLGAVRADLVDYLAGQEQFLPRRLHAGLANIVGLALGTATPSDSPASST